MPISFIVDESQHLVRTTADGIVNDQDILAHVQAIADAQEKSPYTRELADLRNIVIGEVTGEAIREAARIVRSNPAFGGVKVAFVASEDVVFGLSRMFEMLQAEHSGETRVFRQMKPAEEWLGIA